VSTQPNVFHLITPIAHHPPVSDGIMMCARSTRRKRRRIILLAKGDSYRATIFLVGEEVMSDEVDDGERFMQKPEQFKQMHGYDAHYAFRFQDRFLREMEPIAKMNRGSISAAGLYGLVIVASAAFRRACISEHEPINNQGSPRDKFLTCIKHLARSYWSYSGGSHQIWSGLAEKVTDGPDFKVNL